MDARSCSSAEKELFWPLFLSKRGRRAGGGRTILPIIVELIILILFIPLITPLGASLTKIYIRTTCRPISSLYNYIENLIGITNVWRSVQITSRHFFGGQALETCALLFISPLLCGITSRMLLPDSLPIGITDGDDIINGLKQML